MNISSIIGIAVCLLSVRFETASCILRHPGYIELDGHLRGKVNSDDLSDNLEATCKLLQDFLGSPTRQAAEAELFVALREVCALQEMPETAQCDSKEHETLQPLAARTDAHSYHPQPALEFSRVERIIYVVSIAHARQCSPKYPAIYLEMNSDWLSKAPNTYAESFTKRLLGRAHVKIPGLTRERYIQYLLHRDPLILADSPYASAHMKGLKRATQLAFDPNANFQLLYHTFLAEPCRRYNLHFGTGLIELALFDEQMFRTKLEAYNLNDEKAIYFLTARATYLTCKALLSDPEFEAAVGKLVANW